MEIIVLDSEIIRGGRMIESTIDDIVDVSLDFANIMDVLAEEGFDDGLISAELKNKAIKVRKIASSLHTTAEPVMTLVNSYISDIDEKDSYIY